MRTTHRRWIRPLAVAAIAATAATAGGCAQQPADGVTTLNFFQFKGEALEDFNEIIADFEAENPDIRVVQNQVADADTAIRTLLVKDRVPDVITLNANGNFGRLAQAGVFYDFSDEPVLDTINPAVQEILADLGTYGDEVNGLGYVNNANGIIYNQDIFEEQGLEVPETWDELIAVCDALMDAGIQPFYGTLADSWTAIPSW
ncbi:MAG: sugar transporter substrate-binding protein, partial [Agromyces sp.]|nr:sugar transporter substrate-binding protein [Agromyces sp.]